MNRWLTLIIGSGVLLRLAALLLVPHVSLLNRYVYEGDAIPYTRLALSIAETGTFQLGYPTAFRMPGYPLFLTLAYVPFKTPVFAQLIQIALAGVTIWLTFLSAKSLTSDKLAQLAAPALVALNPLLVISSVFIYPESLTLFAVTLATLVLVRFPTSPRAGLVAGLALGAAIYLRPSMSLAVLLLLAAYALRQFSVPARRVSSRVLVALMPFAIVGILLVPWIARNWIVLGGFVPLTLESGYVLYAGNNPNADGGEVSEELYVLPGMSEIESNRVLTERAFDWIQSNPGDFVRLLPVKAFRFFWPLAHSTSGYINVPLPVALGVAGVLLALFLLVVVGTSVLVHRHRLYELGLLAIPTVSLLLVALMTLAGVRFSLPGFPGLAVLAGLGLGALWRARPAQLRRAEPAYLS